MADYKNLERRFNDEKEVLVKFSNFVLLERLIGVLDNLESVCGHLKDQGLEMTYREFKSILKDSGVDEVSALGETFDPEFMEAVEIVEGENEKVVKVIRKGYKMHGKVLRPARVAVGKKEEN